MWENVIYRFILRKGYVNGRIRGFKDVNRRFSGMQGYVNNIHNINFSNVIKLENTFLVPYFEHCF